MIKPIIGKNVFVWVKRAGVYVLTVCGKSCAIGVEQDDIPTSTVGSGTTETFKPGYSRLNFTMSSLGTIDALSRYQFWEFLNDRRTIQDMKVVFTNDFGDILRYEFKAFLTSQTIARDFKAFVNVDLTMRITGDLTETLLWDHILEDVDGDPILDTDGDLIRVL